MKKLGFGLMRLPLLDKNNRSSVDVKEVARMADVFLSRGFTYFDTGYPYHDGASETSFREAVVKRHPREAFTITDKMPLWNVKTTADYERIFREQLGRCGVDHFDYYWLHALGKERYETTQALGGFEFFRSLKEKGLAGHIGFSYHDNADVLDQILREHPEMEYVQLQINYLDWESESIQARRCCETAAKYGRPVVVMEPVKGGKLARLPDDAQALLEAAAPGRSAAEWALRFAASQEGVMTVLSGMSDMAQMQENMDTLDNFTPLAPAELSAAAKAAELIRARIAIPCTGCRYCEAGCPKKIAIPEYLSLYNDQAQFGMSANLNNYYDNLAGSHGRAGDCIRCRKCEGSCPQHIRITEWLPKISALFDGD